MTYVVDAKHRWQRVSEQFRTKREALDRLAELERIGFVGSVTPLASNTCTKAAIVII